MEEVTKKNPKRVEAGKKGYQARLMKMKGQILAGTSNVTSNTSNPTTNVPSTDTSNAWLVMF